jgi:hypothetical protein
VSEFATSTRLQCSANNFIRLFGKKAKEECTVGAGYNDTFRQGLCIVISKSSLCQIRLCYFYARQFAHFAQSAKFLTIFMRIAGDK